MFNNEKKLYTSLHVNYSSNLVLDTSSNITFAMVKDDNDNTLKNDYSEYQGKIQNNESIIDIIESSSFNNNISEVKTYSTASTATFNNINIQNTPDLAADYSPFNEVVAPATRSSNIFDVMINKMLSPLANSPVTLVEFFKDNLETIWDLWSHIDPNIGDYSDPEDFIAKGCSVMQQTFTLTELDNAQIAEIKDAVVAARAGYLDYSTLRFFRHVDKDGYVKDSDGLMDSFVVKFPIYGYEGSGWSYDQRAWLKDNYEVIRVLEEKNYLNKTPYEVNIALLQDKNTGDYTISLAGTNAYSLADWGTDLLNFLTVPASHNEVQSALVDKLFAEDIEEGANVDLVGHSLGGHSVITQYLENPERFDDVYALQPAAVGGIEGMYYDEFLWDGTGDKNITAILTKEEKIDFEFNDAVIESGHIPAGTVYDLTTNTVSGNLLDQLIDSHLLDHLWDAVA